MPEDITTGELGRRIDSMERMIDRRFREMSETLRDMQFVHKDVYQSDQTALIQRVINLEAYKAENEANKKKVIGWIVTGAVLPILVIIVLQWLQLN